MKFDNKFKKQIVIGLIILFLMGGILISKNVLFDKDKNDDFEYDIILLKVAVEKGGETNQNIKIKNNYHKQSHFLIKVNGINDLVSLDKYEFDLEPNEETEIQVFLKTNNTEPGVFLGKLEIESEGIFKEIPIIFEIESKEVFYDSNVNLYPQGDDIVSGQKLNTEIKIFDIYNMGERNVKVDYLIKDFNGRTIISDSEFRIVENTNFFKTLSLPSKIEEGNYVLITLVEYGGEIGTSSLYFKIIKEKKEEAFFEKNIFIVLLILSFFFFIFILFLIYYLFSRDRIWNELEKQYKKEITRQTKIVDKKEKETITKLKNPIEKKQYKKEIRKVKKKRIKALKEIHKKRIKELRKIKKKGTKTQFNRQLKKWKSKGYDVRVLESKFKLPNISNIRRKIKEWKSKGYDTKVLEK